MKAINTIKNLFWSGWKGKAILAVTVIVVALTIKYQFGG